MYRLDGHRFSASRRQNLQVLSVQRSQAAPARSPAANPANPAPSAFPAFGALGALGVLAHGDDLAHDLVAGGDAGAVRRQVALGHVQVGAADAAGQDPQQQFAGSRPRRLVVRVQAQRVAGDRSRRLNMPGSHTGTLLRARWP